MPDEVEQLALALLRRQPRTFRVSIQNEQYLLRLAKSRKGNRKEGRGSSFSQALFHRMTGQPGRKLPSSKVDQLASQLLGRCGEFDFHLLAFEMWQVEWRLAGQRFRTIADRLEDALRDAVEGHISCSQTDLCILPAGHKVSCYVPGK
ncbi:MAG TPA: hypothetical protein VLF41_01230 [Candidatus Nanoarchaeia archaeon]|nr:hypothetical protein [Candidatus Nanoarchaeia archaeon]